MPRLIVILLFGLLLMTCSCTSNRPGLDRELEGVWEEDHSTVKGNMAYSVLAFQNDIVIWQRIHTIDGELLSASSTAYKVTLDPADQRRLRSFRPAGKPLTRGGGSMKSMAIR
jgi:hypothetical protein